MTNRGPRLQFDLPRPSWTSLGRAAQWWIRIVAAVHLAALVGVVVAEHLRKLRDPYRGVFPRMAPWSTEIAGTKATTFTFGEDLYAAMLDSIRSAEHSIYFETFIWKGDEVGAAFKQALIAAARRGVQVYVVMDTWGNLVVDPRFKRFPKLPTLHLLHFPLFRPGLLTFNLRKTGRDHRKILVVDDEVGYVGGYNIGSLYASTWRDTHLRLEGPATWSWPTRSSTSGTTTERRATPNFPTRASNCGSRGSGRRRTPRAGCCSRCAVSTWTRWTGPSITSTSPRPTSSRTGRSCAASLPPPGGVWTCGW
ncbi:phospholipase D-like domain-containing protein [Sanguibacter sp. Z1732]|uniref:phospholipase D-like domain-containing protein n=1 Tax=Sanguibacter sp. Z1732 TaxID=3435412 RepID=UPI003D9C9944